MKLVRLSALLGVLLLTLGAALPAAAQQSFTVFAIAPAAAQAPGTSAAVTIRIQGQVAALPGFVYDVQGATLEGVLAPVPVAANTAEGTVFVRRETPGTARLTVSFAGQQLAAADIAFGAAAPIRVTATLDAGPDAAARTWRYEVRNADGALVAALQLSTSGDAPTGAALTPVLPAGTYTVTQVLGADTALACGPGVFYAVTSPAGAVALVELAGEAAEAAFTIVPCPDLPAGLEVLIPVDTIVPGAGSGIVGEPAPVPPGQTPINQVAGARQPGPGVLPPAAGNSPAAAPPETAPWLALAGLVLLIPGAGVLAVAAIRSRR